MSETNTSPLPSEIKTNANVQYKDRLFRLIFGGKDVRSKRWLLSLYNALNGTDYTDINDITITTIDNAIFITMKNDLSFLINSEIHLYEHQSTVNPNMPLRGLFYFSHLYQAWLANQDFDIYGESLIKIPNPHYVVFYNGVRKQEEIRKFRLSDMFATEDKSGEFEWTATAINVNYGHNEILQKKCKALYDYGVYINEIRKGLDKKMPLDQAVNEALDYVIKQKLLDGFFKEHKAEVKAVSITEFDQELYDKCRRREGAQQKAIEAAINLLKMDLGTVEQIAQAQGLPVEKVQELKSQLKSEKK